MQHRFFLRSKVEQNGSFTGGEYSDAQPDGTRVYDVHPMHESHMLHLGGMPCLKADMMH